MSRLRGSATVEVIPSAKRLVTSLRDLGYDFVHAVADLVDNSVAANASVVDIMVRFDGPESWLRIVDNGHGMNGTQITEAMRYGSDARYEDDDLGKFGLGLKTASMSQCRRLSVASRVDRDVNRVEARQLDLDHVERSNRWEVFIIAADERAPELVEPLASGTGTVVVWEALDRVMSYKMPWGERAKSGLYNLIERLDEHLGMVFHRFLSGDVKRRRKLSIMVNGKHVEPWDPFAREEGATQELPAQEFDVASPDGPVGLARFQPYVLPSRDRFSSEDAFNRLSGPARWNAQQGFYIYRSNRMIQSGGWSWMRTQDEHCKLARASIDFFPDLDSAFGVNVAKARVTLPSDLREKLRPQMEGWIRLAQQTYRQSPPSPGPVPTGPRRGRPPKTAEPGGLPWGTGGQALGEPVSPEVIRTALKQSASKLKAQAELERIMSDLKATRPEVASALGW